MDCIEPIPVIPSGFHLEQVEEDHRLSKWLNLIQLENGHYSSDFMSELILSDDHWSMTAINI